MCAPPLSQEGKPCGGEKLLLMFDRWRKLAKAFYNEKKAQFDISKVSSGRGVRCPVGGIALDGQNSRRG